MMRDLGTYDRDYVSYVCAALTTNVNIGYFPLGGFNTIRKIVGIPTIPVNRTRAPLVW